MIFIFDSFSLSRSLSLTQPSPAHGVVHLSCCHYFYWLPTKSVRFVMNMNSSFASFRCSSTDRARERERAVCLALFLLFRVCTDRLLLFVVCFTWIYHLTYFWYAVPQFASVFFARHYSYCVFCRYCQSSLFILFHRPLFI